MGTYSPLSNPVLSFSFTASAPVTGGDPVEFSPDGKVHRADRTGHYAGIAGYDATTGQTLNVYVGHATFNGTAEGAISAGDNLSASDSPGHQVRAASPGDEIIGKAFTAAADGSPVKWLQTYAG